MPIPEFLAWHRLARERQIEKLNNQKREQAGLPPKSRRGIDNERGPQEPPE
jgi:hypothetical protein